MIKPRVILDRRGVVDLLRSDEAMRMVRLYGDRIARAAGDGFEADSYRGPSRVNSGVRPVTPAAWRMARRNVLLSASRYVGGSGGG